MGCNFSPAKRDKKQTNGGQKRLIYLTLKN